MPCGNTAVPKPVPPVKQALAEYLASSGAAAIGLPEWEAIRRRFPATSAGYLRRLVRQAGLPLAPLVEGVRQDSAAELERTLLALQAEYSAADPAGRQACRRLVIEAKDHARLSLRRSSPDKAAPRREAMQWMIVWLENPAAFPAWLRLRKKTLASPAPPADE